MNEQARIFAVPFRTRPEPELLPLVVDLDGTLARTDTLHEATLGMVAADPALLLRLPEWLSRGKAALKAEVASRRLADPAALPWRAEVLDLIAAARAEGRQVLLVSAADQRQVDAVGEHLGLFDECRGSNGVDNLSGKAKAAWLEARFGVGGFDYVGDSSADLPVWASARKSITVGASADLREKAEARAGAEHLVPRESRLQGALPYLRAMRPHQWSKNLLIFAPALAAHAFVGMGALIAAFICFSLAASAVYLINDMLDVSSDRAHPRKRKRPFAAGDASIKGGMILAVGLTLGAFGLALLATPPLFVAALAGYFALTFAYSLTLKRKLMLDVCTLAGLYTMRVIAGAAAVSVAISPWLLAFSMFLFLALAAVKREAELSDMAARGKEHAAGRAYRASDLPTMLTVATAAGFNAVLVLALYVSSQDVAALYSRPEALWLMCPPLLYWIGRMVMLAHRGEMDDDPIVFAAKDRVSLGIFALCAMAVTGAALL